MACISVMNNERRGSFAFTSDSAMPVKKALNYNLMMILWIISRVRY